MRGDALAAAGLADQAERLAGPDVQRDAVDRLHHAVMGEEVGPQIVDLRWLLRATDVRSRHRVRVGGVAHAVAQEVERQHGD